MKTKTSPEPAGQPVKAFHRWSWIGPASGGALLAVVAVGACMKTPAMPAVDGAAIEIRRSERSIPAGESGYPDTLQILWFGSACHEIRLGGLSVVTDPFVTNGLKLRRLESDPDRVNETFGLLPPPAAVLVNHSHHDHLLDAHAALSLDAWKNVPLYGGATCKNLLAGWQVQQVTDRCVPVTPAAIPFIDSAAGDGPVVPAGHQLKVTAYAGKHSPHAGSSTVLFSGRVTSPETKRPDSPGDFKLGEVLNYLIEMRCGDTRFKVFFLGGPGDAEDLPEIDVDVVILPSPGAARIPGYPAAHLARLKPRHIVVNHFNNLFACEPAKARDTQATLLRIDVANLEYLSREIQKAVTSSSEPGARFERLHLPAISVMESPGRARNVLRITKASGTPG